MKNTKNTRALIARIGGYALRARRDPMEYTAKARAAFLAGFERKVDPDGLLSPEERQRRAVALRKAHMHGLALRRGGAQ
jgi:hypothetical protein